MSGTVTPPTESYQVVWMVCAATSPWLDVVYLQHICTVTEGTAESIPPIHFPPHFLADVRAHGVCAFLLHLEALLSAALLAALSVDYVSARAGASPFISTLAPHGTMERARNTHHRLPHKGQQRTLP